VRFAYCGYVWGGDCLALLDVKNFVVCWWERQSWIGEGKVGKFCEGGRISVICVYGVKPGDGFL